MTVEARVAIRMELQGQQEFEKSCMEGDPGAESRMGFMGSNTIQKMRWGKDEALPAGWKGKIGTSFCERQTTRLKGCREI